MTVSLNVSLTNLRKSPFVAGNKFRSIRAWTNLLMELATGRYKGSVTCAVQNSAVAATGTVTFSGPLTAADTVTINGTALTAQQSYARGTVTAASVSAADTVTVGATVFTAVNGGSPTSVQFDMSGSDAQTATNLGAAINAHPTAGALVKAYVASAVVTARNLVIGVAGNNGGASQVALASSNNTRLAVAGVSSGKLSGASDPANNKFDIGNTTLEVLTYFVAAVNASSTALVSGQGGVLATSNGATVATLTAVKIGSSGNAITLAKSAANAAVSGARLTGGSETAFSFTF